MYVVDKHWDVGVVEQRLVGMICNKADIRVVVITGHLLRHEGVRGGQGSCT